jgi:hypothetical protein
VADEKLPHVEEAAGVQLAVHLTPALLLSLLTIAVKLAVPAVASEVGAAALKLTEMTAGGGVDPPPPPHPTSQTVINATTNRGNI